MERELADREVMRWFRSLAGVEQAVVSICPRERGYTMIAPRRRVPAGRNVYCSLCPTGWREPVWFTNEPGDKGRRAAQVAAARHLRRHSSAGQWALLPDGPAGTAAG